MLKKSWKQGLLFLGSMYPWLLELVVLCYLKDFGSLSLPYFNTYHCLLQHLWTYESEPKQRVLSQFEFPELLQFCGASIACLERSELFLLCLASGFPKPKGSLKLWKTASRTQHPELCSCRCPRMIPLLLILLMEEILHQLRFVVYPIIFRVLYISGGAGFLPSTSCH